MTSPRVIGEITPAVAQQELQDDALVHAMRSSLALVRRGFIRGYVLAAMDLQAVNLRGLSEPERVRIVASMRARYTTIAETAWEHTLLLEEAS